EARSRQEDVARSHAVRTLERANGRPVAGGDRGERVAGPDEVGVVDDGAVDCGVTRVRRAAAGEERALRRRPRDPVDGEPVGALEAAYRPLRPRPEVAVQVRRREAATAEQELEHGDVPADSPARERPRAEERPSEPAEPRPCPRSGEAVRPQAGGALEDADAGRRARAGDPVYRPEAVPPRAQRDLEAGHLRRRDRAGGPR